MSKYKLRTVGRLSSRPIMSIGSYISLDAECLVAGSSDRHLRFLDKENLVEVAKCRVEKKSVNFVSISDMSPEGDDPIIVTGGKDSSVQIWNPSDGSLEKNIELPTKEVRSLAIYQGSETYLVIGTKEAKVIVWDVKRNVLVRIFEGHKASVHCVLISSPPVDFDTQNDMDFLCIASGGADRTVRTWDLKTGKRRKKFRHKRSIAAMVVANKGIRPLLATGGVERAIKLWDVETGVLLRTLDGHLDQINSLTLWEGYQMLLISGSSDHTIRIYDILSGECIIILQGHADAVLGVAISDKDHPKIVSCSDDMTLIQWSLEEIIADFFCDDDENLGARNIVPAYLPEVDYVAPAEPDRKALTKEERRQLRREQKREKKIRSSKHAVAGTIIHNPNLLSSSKGGATGTGDNWDDDDDEFDPYKEDFEDEINEDLMETQLRMQQLAASEEAARLAAEAQNAEGYDSFSLGGMLSPGGSTKVLPYGEEVRGGENTPGAVTVRKASIMVMKNIMGKVMGLGGSAAVEPLDESTAAAAGGAKRGSVANDAKTEESNLRAQANAAQNKFNIAEIEKELETERKKKAAADKLAFRLNMKKLQKGGGEGEDQLTDLGQMELQAQKTEKLRQHKLQESRRHQSMMVAKERSANALQKRLQELAAQRQNLPASFEEEDSDDSNDENKKSGKSKKVATNGTANGQGSNNQIESNGAVGASSKDNSTLALNKKKVIYISDEEYESPIDD